MHKGTSWTKNASRGRPSGPRPSDAWTRRRPSTNRSRRNGMRARTPWRRTADRGRSNELRSSRTSMHERVNSTRGKDSGRRRSHRRQRRKVSGSRRTAGRRSHPQATGRGTVDMTRPPPRRPSVPRRHSAHWTKRRFRPTIRTAKCTSPSGRTKRLRLPRARRRRNRSTITWRSCSNGSAATTGRSRRRPRGQPSPRRPSPRPEPSRPWRSPIRVREWAKTENLSSFLPGRWPRRRSPICRPCGNWPISRPSTPLTTATVGCWGAPHRRSCWWPCWL